MPSAYYADRVRDTSTTTGTGNFTLANSAPSGFQTFNTAFGTGSTAKFYYCIEGVSGEWEVGIGYLSASTTLVRETVLASSNSGSAVNFSAGTKYVFCTIPADGAGFRDLPPNEQSANYTLVASDSGRSIVHPSTDANTRTFTIPANSSVPFRKGTTVTFINRTSQVLSIAITTDTMYLANSTSTGTRSLAQNGIATAYKAESTVWIISGIGLS